MILPDGTVDIPRGKIAAIATTLERRMDASVDVNQAEVQENWSFELISDPKPDWYFDLWRRVGGPHLWYGRLIQSEREVAEYLGAKTTTVFAFKINGQEKGITDLDFSGGDTCELVYFGVMPELAGSGAARFMMRQLLAFVAKAGVSKLWLRTNTIDHTRAMTFYRRAGFVPIRQHLEIADDPRLTGHYPRGNAPQVPIFEGQDID